MTVFVLGKDKKPLMPCSEKRARFLLERGRAVVHRIEPFTIRLKDRRQNRCELQPLRLKLDPGSKTTGAVLLMEQGEAQGKAIFLAQIRHKQGIKEALKERSDLRGSRRGRNTRYREKRFDNRTRPEGWLAPSLLARVVQTMSAVAKLRRFAPAASASCEFVKFDTQLLQNPEISGVEYQQGELFGYEVREYLLEKWNRKCAYCHAKDIALEVEHVIAKARGGSDRVSNLTLACRACNEDKGSLLPKEWLEKCAKRNNALDKLRIANMPNALKELKKPLSDAAAVNSTRKKLIGELRAVFGEVELASGAVTKMNRIAKGLPKEHYYDALCVGRSVSERLNIAAKYASVWNAKGKGNRQMARVDKYGFPLHHQDPEKYDKDGNRKGHRQRKKSCFGFQTGDLVHAIVTKGKRTGEYKGRVAIRHNGSFNIACFDGTLAKDIGYKYCRLLQRGDGWAYAKTKTS